MASFHRPRRPHVSGGAGRRSLASEHRPDDIDPNLYFGASDDTGSDRKTLQLCRQVARALSTSLSDGRDDLLSDVYVDAVQPAPDASRLLVVVRTFGSALDASAVLQRLSAHKGRLRSVVADAITRKRAPELAFLVAGAREEV